MTESLNWQKNILTCITIGRQRFGKRIPATHARNSRTSVARQRRGKLTLATIEEAVWSASLILIYDTCFI
jgi:hypothetical protein